MNNSLIRFLPLLSGLLFTLAWPENGWAPLIFLAWIPLLFSSDYYMAHRKKKFFPILYLSFFLFNLFTTYWIWYATPVGAIVALTANSFLMAFTFWIWHKFRAKLPRKMAWALLPALWISFEKLHYVWDLEWPWLTMGNVFAASPEQVQWYEFTGVFGGTLWILLVNMYVYFWIKNRSRFHTFRWVFTLFLPLILSFFLYRSYREKGEEASVLLLQPNIDPWTEKFDRKNSESIVDLIKLAEPYADSVDLIIAPETALARAIDKDDMGNEKFTALLMQFKQKHPRADWLIGATLYNFVDKNGPIPSTANQTRAGDWYQLYNSALYYKSDNQPEMYHKKILVPGAEKMPFHRFLSPLIGDIVLNLGGATGTHTPSPQPVVFENSNRRIKVAPIICYESVFGDYVRRYVQKGANLLAVITNDGWWKKTGGYRQHFHYARLRSIENRRDLVRSANTGRSGHINQRGDIMASLAYDRRGVLVVKPRLNEEITFYARHGDFIARVAVFVALVLLIYGLGKKRIKLSF